MQTRKKSGSTATKPEPTFLQARREVEKNGLYHYLQANNCHSVGQLQQLLIFRALWRIEMDAAMKAKDKQYMELLEHAEAQFKLSLQPAPSNKLVTVVEQREDLRKTSWDTYKKLSGVTTDKQMQLQVIFNLVRTMAYDIACQTNDNDYKTRINHEQAVFEKALEMESFFNSTGLKS